MSNAAVIMVMLLVPFASLSAASVYSRSAFRSAPCPLSAVGLPERRLRGSSVHLGPGTHAAHRLSPRPASPTGSQTQNEEAKNTQPPWAASPDDALRLPRYIVDSDPAATARLDFIRDEFNQISKEIADRLVERWNLRHAQKDNPEAWAAYVKVHDNEMNYLLAQQDQWLGLWTGELLYTWQYVGRGRYVEDNDESQEKSERMKKDKALR
ncbi:unnamed protein product [Vitrella brassicaformis CCMP3155]|uniref:Uncharacterized protein n=2 Tax=Vitrella brassicaformis TaxID=1169539 RepID=A0A0G4FUV1_VITBC|nr:unnamed protein product [Vitrella brassicaformis CCMP3155]|eukprot:CEM18501.1 unnamed protein product [Vitrella brassicaformis CCMP3155]